MARAPITRGGYNQLQKDLDNLKKVVRPQVVKAIEEARAHGDLSENAEYVAAKEQQAFTEKKIYEIEQRLATCEIIDACNFSTDKVGFGTMVTLQNLNNGGEVTYQIVVLMNPTFLPERSRLFLLSERPCLEKRRMMKWRFRHPGELRTIRS